MQTDLIMLSIAQDRPEVRVGTRTYSGMTAGLTSALLWISSEYPAIPGSFSFDCFSAGGLPGGYKYDLCVFNVTIRPGRVGITLEAGDNNRTSPTRRCRDWLNAGGSLSQTNLFGKHVGASQQAQDVELMLVWRWSTVYDSGPMVNQHWFNVLCTTGADIKLTLIQHLVFSGVIRIRNSKTFLYNYVDPHCHIRDLNVLAICLACST